jgi:hypothetical protein
MQAILPGMTREALYQVFTTEGGLSTGLQRTFVSRDCAYFKVDVEFQAVGRPDRDGNGRVTLVEDGKDIILKISRAYLQFNHGLIRCTRAFHGHVNTLLNCRLRYKELRLWVSNKPRFDGRTF